MERLGTLLQNLKKNTFEKYNAFTVGEVFSIDEDALAQFIGENGHFSTIFDFSAHCLSDGKHGWYDATPITFDRWRNAIVNAQLEAQKCGFKANIIENHDEPRGVSRFLPDYAKTPAGAKMLGTVSVLLRGIPFLYQGQEIGMTNAVWNSIEEYDDISTKDQYQIARMAGLSDAEALEVCGRMSRDNARTPVQWSGEQNAGFTSGTPWMKVNANYPEINVAQQEQDKNSVLNYYRKLIALRKSDAYQEVFTYGSFIPAYADSENVMAYYRADEKKRILVAANFGKEALELPLDYAVKSILLSNQTNKPAETTWKTGEQLKLESCEVIVLECEN